MGCFEKGNGIGKQSLIMKQFWCREHLLILCPEDWRGSCCLHFKGTPAGRWRADFKGQIWRQEVQLGGWCSNACEICGRPKLRVLTVRMEIGR